MSNCDVQHELKYSIEYSSEKTEQADRLLLEMLIPNCLPIFKIIYDNDHFTPYQRYLMVTRLLSKITIIKPDFKLPPTIATQIIRDLSETFDSACIHKDIQLVKQLVKNDEQFDTISLNIAMVDVEKEKKLSDSECNLL